MGLWLGWLCVMPAVVGLWLGQMKDEEEMGLWLGWLCVMRAVVGLLLG